jgi:NADH dehydrogenase FAD-containing subunit
MADTKKKIVIIGNGYGGSKITAALAKLAKFDITVVTPLRYHEV